MHYQIHDGLSDPESSPTNLGRLQRALVCVGDWLARGAVSIGILRLMAGRIDRLDERAARRIRVRLGRRRCLVSWQREPGGRWRARLSGPELLHTIERTAWTRCRAIARSASALGRLPELRARIGKPPESPPESESPR